MRQNSKLSWAAISAKLLFGLMLLVASATHLITSSAAKSAAKPAESVEKKPPPAGLDDALLKDLDNELLEGAGDLKNTPKAQPPTPRPAGPPAEAKQEAGEDIG